MSSGASWFARLRSGLARSSDKLTGGLAGLVGRGPLDEGAIESIEDALIAADLGPAVAGRIAGRLREGRFERGATLLDVQQVAADEIAAVLRPVARPLEVIAFPRPQTILIVGVNGSGKTTTIAKLAHLFVEQDYRVMLAAGDTFRAAAIEQLKIWGDRAGAPVVAGAQGADAAGVAYGALEQAIAEGRDALIIDTAGRLQNKAGLMDELAKMRRVLGKLRTAAPHDVVLVLDATTGQNALSQIEIFGKTAGVTGLVMTKLDGTARGGMLVAAAETFRLPIHAVGVGERIDDLRPFDPDEFARALVGLSG
ncbi:MAG: signal recognition particle-docking protein FtsY [Sphingomonadaceae bacterium]|nr:signal recognition particle-docking protein FtsY [Sphingomonadaceae bacterium]